LGVRSFIKIYGPPVLKAVKALEKIAIDMPEVCIMNTIISDIAPSSLDFRETEDIMSYFRPLGDIQHGSAERTDREDRRGSGPTRLQLYYNN